MVMAGYADESGKRGSGLDQGWFVTSDLGEIHPDGTVQVLGRADDVIITGGKKVMPQQVESRLLECPGIAESSVVGVPDPTWGAIVCAVYQGDIPVDSLLAWCRDHLSGAERPRQAVQVEQLPQLANGKPDRRAIQALAKRTGMPGA